jgi:hypothetical protein
VQRRNPYCCTASGPGGIGPYSNGQRPPSHGTSSECGEHTCWRSGSYDTVLDDACWRPRHSLPYPSALSVHARLSRQWSLASAAHSSGCNSLILTVLVLSVCLSSDVQPPHKCGTDRGGAASQTHCGQRQAGLPNRPICSQSGPGRPNFDGRHQTTVTISSGGTSEMCTPHRKAIIA